MTAREIHDAEYTRIERINRQENARKSLGDVNALAALAERLGPCNEEPWWDEEE